ncbi:hypothetical protein L1280_002020 [Deinococcus sp. HSC-46F16]|uniref:hypothetical protein n=1 Tax=Deinococcus sp. HSC-46F16 TaxID=2910968 RepID=UPI00209DD68C|nr:hypothetical protein [Deinococcus sp. HSC-46F16]MCP2014868.1 hypothetical protein [Deinococcus sp. HSC-46F16]
MRQPASSGQPPAFGGIRLVLLMLGLAGLGVVLGLLRAVSLEGPGWWSLASWTPLLLAPVGVMAALALWLGRRQPTAAAWGGVGAALASVWASVSLLHPEVNRDANLGMGLYGMLGWLFPLGPAFGVGAGLGLLAEGRHGLPPSPAALEDARPRPPVRPWLWPLVPPALVSLAVSVQPFGRVAREGAGDWIGLLVAALVTSAGQLAVILSPALIALLALRGRTARDGIGRPRLAAFWGLCLGLAVTLGLFGFGQSALVPRLSLEVYILLHAAPPLIGYAVGWWLGRREEAVP